MTIDLAPQHKLGFVVDNPILLGAGTIGYGEVAPKGLELAKLGGAVVGRIQGASRGGAQPPRLAHLNGGIVLTTGLQNRGLNSAVQRYARLWPRLGCPVIAQIADSHPVALAKVVIKLNDAVGLSGLELLLPAQADVATAANLVRTVVRHTDLPLWVKTPLATAPLLAPAVVEAGAAGLVVGQPLAGAGLRWGTSGGKAVAGDNQVVGDLFGPLAFAPMLATLLQVAALQLPCVLIACGGIHTLDQVHQALAAGAAAVQVDSPVWVEPGLPGQLVAGLAMAQGYVQR